jgi:hypothetical protein
MVANHGASAAGASSVQDLAGAFARQVASHLGVPIEHMTDASSLAYADHYLALLRDETREPILSLVSAQAGAWFGELVCREIGATWVGAGRTMRLVLEPAFVHFCPADQALEAALAESPDEGDVRVPEGLVIDGAFQLRTTPSPGFSDEPSDAEWVSARLDERPPVPQDEFFSLTGRFETLRLVLELLAARGVERGEGPTRYHLNDYTAEIMALVGSDIEA